MHRPLVRWVLNRAAHWLHQHGGRLFHGGERVVSATEAVGLINGVPVDTTDDWLALTPPPAALEDDAALGQLAARFELSTAATALLAAIVAPAISVQVQRLYRFMTADDRPPSVGFLAELISDTPDAADAVLLALHPHRTLMGDGLVAMTANVGQGRRALPAPDVLDALRGLTPTTPWPWACERCTPTAWSHQAGLQAAVDAGGALHLMGAPGSGRLAALTAATPTLCLDASRIALTPDVLQVTARIARLRGERFAIRIDRPLEDEAFTLLRDWSTARALTLLTQSGVPVPHPGRQVAAPQLDAARQTELWRDLLADPRWADDLPDRLAARFDLGPSLMHAALASRPASEAALFEAIRARPPHRLGEFARVYTTGMTWDDVILPPEVDTTLREIVAYARNQDTVLAHWGFNRLLPYGRGLGCLFAGPPGTGKTMMAGILAQALGREVFRVDISKLVSKWLGETEKNLSTLFDEAAKAKAVLFFDEADSLFAKRTGVKSSNDRHANMEVNHLLQRMERYDGISILATNLSSSLDEAFKRRLRFIVHFEAPDAEARGALWAKMIPAEAPLAEGIRFAKLGKHFKLTGGHIKNAVVRAAFLAAAAGTAIDEALLVQAGEAETRALGRL